MSKPIPIKKLLDSLIAEKGWRDRVELHGVFASWNDLVGQDIAGQAQPHVIHKTILWIRVSDSVWMQQLHLLKEMLLARLNSRLRKVKLTDLRFQLDSSLGHAEREIGGKSSESPPSPSAEQRESFELLLESINDPEVKEAIRRCWLKTGHLRGRTGAAMPDSKLPG